MLVLATLLGAVRADGQNPIDDYRESIEAQRSIYLVFTNGGRPAFYLEDEPPTKQNLHPLNKRVTFVVPKERGVNLLVGFVNPLRYALSLSETAAHDPNYTTVNQLAESFSALAKTLKVDAALSSPVSQVTTPTFEVPVGTSTGAATQSVLSAKSANAWRAFLPPDHGDADAQKRVSFFDAAAVGVVRTSKNVSDAQKAVDNLLVPQVYSRDLVLWALEAAETERLACLGRHIDEAKALLDAAGDADTYVYAGAANGADAKRPAAAYARYARSIPGLLLRPDDLESFRRALADAAQVRDSLAEFDDRTATAIRALTTAAGQFAAAVPTTESRDCRNFTTYTVGAVGNFESAAHALLAERVATRTAIAQSIAELTDYIRDNATRNDANALRLSSIEVPAGALKDVALVIQPRLADTTGGRLTLRNGTADTLTIRVRRRQSLITEFSLGAAYLQNIAYPRFGTTDSAGPTRVAKVDADLQRQTVVGMLNLLIPRVLGPVVPGVQVGLGTGTRNPIMLVGGVFRFLTGTSFALSAGVALPWYQELVKLRPGDPVTGTADIESDLRYHLGRGSLYVGIQKSL